MNSSVMPNTFIKLSTPSAQKRPVNINQLGRGRTDNYAWLKDQNWQDVMDDPSLLQLDIREHLLAENTYCAALMDDTLTLQNQLFAEMKGRIKDDDSTVPAPDGEFEYALRYRAGDQHGLYIRTPLGAKTQQEQLLLDADALAAGAKEQGHNFFDIGDVAHSDNHKYLAYAVDVKGSERYCLSIIDLASKKTIGTSIENTSGDFIWAKDNKTLFWIERDNKNRPCKVYTKNILGADARTVLVYEEKDPGFFVSLSRSDTGNFIEITCNDHTSSETWILPASQPLTAPICAEPRQALREYTFHDHANDFYILTNAHGATDFKIMKTQQDQPQSRHWQNFIAYKPGTLILGMETYQGHLVRLERVNALPRIVIHDLSTHSEHVIEFDEDVYALGLMGGYEFNTNWLRFSYSSPTTPSQIFDYNMKTQERIFAQNYANTIWA